MWVWMVGPRLARGPSRAPQLQQHMVCRKKTGRGGQNELSNTGDWSIPGFSRPTAEKDRLLANGVAMAAARRKSGGLQWGDFPWESGAKTHRKTGGNFEAQQAPDGVQALPRQRCSSSTTRENLGGDAGGVRSSGTPGATMQRGRAAPRQLRANKQIDK
jgi:hypothetical protein